MSLPQRVTKTHATGNDFVVYLDKSGKFEPTADEVRFLCDRHFGIGGDGLIRLTRPDFVSDLSDDQLSDVLAGGTKWFMDYRNADGSLAEMCGNGIRCFVKFIIEKGIVPAPDVSVETLSGIKKTHAELSDGAVVRIGVNMGEPKLDCADIPVSAEGDFLQKSLYSHGRRFVVSCVNTGIPHTVVFVDDVDLTDVEYYGRDIEHSPIFPKRTNVDFVQVIDRENIIMRTWERGCGSTMCCGTGACASAAACILAKHTERRVNVHVEIGTLGIEWLPDNTLYMSGPAATVCEGVYHYE